MCACSFNTDACLFHSGNSKRAYELLGARREGDCYVFRVWSPSATAAFVVGDFNYWGEDCPMVKITQAGIWEAKINASRISINQKYKFKLYNKNQVFYKADPYGFFMENSSSGASIISDISYEWGDKAWLDSRKHICGKNFYNQPINIYEVHLGSFLRRGDGGYYSYSDLSAELIPYIKQMGYTHIELLPISEHPCDSSWGYQVGGFFAPSSRFGSPIDFMRFIDDLHRAGIGVILDVVCAHFAVDEFGLSCFDGEEIYGYKSKALEGHSWGTEFFDLGCSEVQSFLISNIHFWAEKYHIDGLRLDAVSAMIYEEVNGERCENLEGIEFVKRLNREMKASFPDILMIAEESSAFQTVTRDGGLGFDLKWNMGWTYDSLSYIKKPFDERKNNHRDLTFPTMYAYDELFVLPLSHDDVARGKGSLIGKMSGDYWQKFASLRLFALYHIASVGKKLTFMGNEIAQFDEWNCDSAIQWSLLDFDAHAKHQMYISELNHFYLEERALWDNDSSKDSFCWLDAERSEENIVAFTRKSRLGEELVFLLNFSPKAYREYILKLFCGGEYEEIFNTDSQRFGGSGFVNDGIIYCNDMGDRCFGINVKLPPLGAIVLKRRA